MLKNGKFATFKKQLQLFLKRQSRRDKQPHSDLRLVCSTHNRFTREDRRSLTQMEDEQHAISPGAFLLPTEYYSKLISTSLRQEKTEFPPSKRAIEKDFLMITVC